MDIHREVYSPSPQPGKAPWLSTRYVGAGLKREENLSFMTSSDWPHDARSRTSDDDGQTWTPWQETSDDHPVQGEFTRWQGVFARVHDPAGGLMVRAVLVRLLRGDPREALVATAGGGSRSRIGHWIPRAWLAHGGDDAVGYPVANGQDVVLAVAGRVGGDEDQPQIPARVADADDGADARVPKGVLRGISSEADVARCGLLASSPGPSTRAEVFGPGPRPVRSAVRTERDASPPRHLP